jgi:mRNA-degrading endonuclease RelE of RelBE toxin-antitoxin system
MVRLPRKDQAGIIVVLRSLAEDPRPPGCRPVKDALKGTYRVRVDSYRLIHTVVDADHVVVVARVAKRDESTYRELR